MNGDMLSKRTLDYLEAKRDAEFWQSCAERLAAGIVGGRQDAALEWYLEQCEAKLARV